MAGKPLLLDLFCGAGGAGVGYERAGFDVIGVDIEPQPNYPYRFIQDDAIAVLDALDLDDVPALSDIAAIHASPPCQAYTTMNNRHASSSPPLIQTVRERLISIGLPYVIENVAGALRHMHSPIELTGEMFGLGVHRPRLFESNMLLLSPARPRRQESPAAVYGKNDGRRLWTRADGSELRVASYEDACVAMGVDWMTWDELREAIPPAYTEYLGDQLLQHLGVAA